MPQYQPSTSSQVAANILAQTANVPCIPWSGDGLEANLNSEGAIPDEIFQSACVTTVDEALAAGERIGYPIMIKVCLTAAFWDPCL